MADVYDPLTDIPDPSRAEAFSDAVFAIVITLLTVDLHPPDVPPGHLIEGLLNEWPTYLAYVTSYLYIAVIWTNHRYAFSRIRAVDRSLHWINLFVLSLTALLPFATAVVSKSVQIGNLADQRTAVDLYALVGALVCVTWVVFFHYLHRHRQLLKAHVPEGFFRLERARAWAGVVLYVVAGILGHLLVPGVALTIFLALPIFYGLTAHGLHGLTITRSRHR